MLSKLRDLLILTIIATTSEAQISVPAMSLPRDATIEMRPVVLAGCLPADAVSRTITLARPSAAERACAERETRERSRPGTQNAKRRGPRNRLPRLVDAPDNALRLADLPWHRVDDGTRGARRAHIARGRRDPCRACDRARARRSRMRFAGSLRDRAGVRPLLQFVAGGRHAVLVTGLEGETATIRAGPSRGRRAGDAVLRMPMISHLGVPGADSKHSMPTSARRERARPMSLAWRRGCNSNWRRRPNAVARIFVTVKGVTIICSGTLLNDAEGSLDSVFPDLRIIASTTWTIRRRSKGNRPPRRHRQ